MSYLGKVIHLKGTSQKGKNRIRDKGERWRVLAETDRILFSAHKDGPWLWIVPVDEDLQSKSSRWIHVSKDLDFSINDTESVD